MSEYRNCRLNLDGRVLEVALARPEARNALDYASVEELIRALREAAADADVGAVLIHGEGPCFCAGGDLREFAEGLGQDAFGYHRTGAVWAELMTLVPSLRLPVVVAPHRYALAGGTGIVAAADVAIAAAGTKFGLPEIGIGLFPAIVFGNLVRAVGPSAARELALSGRRFDAEEALRLGLVHRISTAEGYLDDAREAAAQIAAYGTDALSLAKEFMRTAESVPLDEATAYGKAMRGAFMETADFHAGIARATGKAQ